MWRIGLMLSIVLCVGFAYSEPPSPGPAKADQQKKSKPTNAQDRPNQELQGTKEKPLVVDILPAPDAEKVAKRKTDQEEEKSTLDRWLTGATVALAVITFFLALYTARLWEATSKLVAGSERTAAMQMRAYCTVIVNDGVFQESGKNIRFEARPRIVNTGNTPAHKVRYRAAAAILPIALPDDFTFPLPDTDIGGAVLGPHHHFDIGAVVDNFVLDADVESIKRCRENALHIWGTLSYMDIFGEERKTKFCHMVIWFNIDGKEPVFGYYNARHNEAT